jgi:hypothetical protein
LAPALFAACGGTPDAGTSLAVEGSDDTVSSSGAQTALDLQADRAFFIDGQRQAILKLREWFMSPLDESPTRPYPKPGYDPEFGLIRGGYWGGNGWTNGFVLLNAQLILAKPLDEWNAEVGIRTQIHRTFRGWFTDGDRPREFVNAATGQGAAYNGQDRREVMFGRLLPCIRDTSGQEFYVRGHGPSDATPIVTALPSACAAEPSGSRVQPMNTYALWIELYARRGNTARARELFERTLDEWTPADIPNSSRKGGYFSAALDAQAEEDGKTQCRNSRVLAYWLHAARVTGFWNTSDRSRRIARQVSNQLWSHQLTDGGIRVAYRDCGRDRASPESSGLTLLAHTLTLP